MTAQPTGFGRKIPPTDWEGDDLTPGAGGMYVTCTDTAAGRMAYWATNGRVDIDGRVIRAHVSPPDPDGLTMAQAAQGLHSATGLTMVVGTMTAAQRLAWLRRGLGLVVPGMYGAVPRAYRFQASADFAHAIFFDFVGHDGKSVRKHDPLNPNTHTFGETMPLADALPFLNSLLAWPVGYVPLQHP